MSLTILAKHLHAALGAYLAEVGQQPAEVSLPAMVQPELPLRPSHPPAPVEAAPEVTPAPAPAVEVAKDEPEEEIAPPSVLDLQDANYPREKLVKFLASRGYPKDEMAMLPRPELNAKAKQAAEAMLQAAPGVKKRGKKAAAPAAPPAGENGMAEAVKALDADQRRALSLLMQVPMDAGFDAAVIDLLGNPGALKEALSAAMEVAKESAPQAAPEVPVAVATVVSAPPIPIPQPVVAAQPEVVTETLGARILREATAELGYDGSLYNYITSEIAAQYMAPLEKTVQDGLKGEGADVLRQYLKMHAPPGADSCGGKCTACPRGAAQLSACLKVFDDDPSGGSSDYDYATVVRTGSLVLFRPVTTAYDDSSGGEAVVESIT